MLHPFRGLKATHCDRITVETETIVVIASRQTSNGSSSTGDDQVQALAADALQRLLATTSASTSSPSALSVPRRSRLITWLKSLHQFFDAMDKRKR